MTCHREHIDNQREREVRDCGDDTTGLDLLALLAIFPSVISSFFTQNKVGGGGADPPAPLPSLDPPLIKS